MIYVFFKFNFNGFWGFNNKNEKYDIKDVDEFGNLIVLKDNEELKISYGEISFQD